MLDNRSHDRRPDLPQDIATSSAGIERIFSTAGLIQSPLRNRLWLEKVGRLVTVSRLFVLNTTRVEEAESQGLEELMDAEVN